MTHFIPMLAGGLSAAVPLIVLAVVIVLFAFIVVFASRYKKCPSDKIMVIYGKVAPTATARSALPSAFTAVRRSSFRSCSRMSIST